ncbi:MAG TPA: hypothetical protein VGR29_11240 [Thermomicrobiales bacterium]|nr:hypothetical protein [Thermomicrobiales bacterium]
MRGTALLTVLMLYFLLPGVPEVMAAQAQPDPPPETLPYFYDPSDVFPEDQQVTLTRDARLMQRSGIPSVVYVRTATAGEAGKESSRAFADTVRREWNVESSPDADDGLVILLSYVPDNPAASTAVASWGTSTFHDSGLTPEYVQSVLDRDVRTLLDMEFPFEAMVYGLRQIRYGGIYFPPPPDPLEGGAKTLHDVLRWVGPVLTIGMVSAFVALSLRRHADKHMAPKFLWKTAGLTGMLVVMLSVLSVIGRSRVGIGSALLILVALAIQAWLWSHPPRQQARHIERRTVPPTSQRLRKRRQARRMLATGMRR